MIATISTQKIHMTAMLLCRDLLVELCLTVPARPSTILPHLSTHMRPIVSALQASNELVSLGLRTLEFWIDTLHPEYLGPMLDKIEEDLMLALCQHLRPGSQFGQPALRILGKLGGRNRQ